MDALIVDLEIGAPEEVFPVWCAPNIGKYIFHGAGDYTGLVLVACLCGRMLGE